MSKRNDFQIGTFAVVQHGGWSIVGKRGTVIAIHGDIVTLETPYGQKIIRNYKDLELS